MLWIVSAIKVAIILSIMCLGVHISFRILDTADLSIEGTFPLGGCICALLIVSGVNPYLATFIAFLAGGAAGFITGILHTKFKIPMILSGIITLTALFAINGMICATTLTEKTSIVISQIDTMSFKNTVFAPVANLLKEVFCASNKLANNLSTIIVSALFLALVFGAIYYFFGTELGMSIRSTGDNKEMSRAQGINTDFTIILGLVISNALIALSAALFVQNSLTARIDDGVGKIVVGLSAIIIGETIFGRKSYKLQLISIICGTIIYYLIESVVIRLSSDLGQIRQLISAIVLTIFLIIPLIKKKIKSNITRKGDNHA